MGGLILLTTYNCNFNCKFCLFRDRLNSNSIDIKLLKLILEQFKSLGYNFICLSGGEPCLHPQFNDLVKVIMEQGFSFGIVSNGYFYKRYIPLLKYGDKFRFISFSLDSGVERLHDKFRGRGSFKKVIRGIQYFLGKNKKVRVAMILNKKNYASLEKSILFLDKKIRPQEIRVGSVIKQPWNQDLVLSNNERRKVFDTLIILRNKVKTPVFWTSSLKIDDDITFCPNLRLEGLTINPIGELIFCCNLPKKGAVLGDLRKEKLTDLIKKGEKIANYLKDKRKAYLESWKKIEGYDTCYFCNALLKKKLINLARIRKRNYP